MRCKLFKLYYKIRNSILLHFGIILYIEPESLPFPMTKDDYYKDVFGMPLNEASCFYACKDLQGTVEYCKALSNYLEPEEIKKLLPVAVGSMDVGELYKRENQNDIADSLQYAIRTRCMPARPFSIDVYPESVAQHTHVNSPGYITMADLAHHTHSRG